MGSLRDTQIEKLVTSVCEFMDAVTDAIRAFIPEKMIVTGSDKKEINRDNTPVSKRP